MIPTQDLPPEVQSYEKKSRINKLLSLLHEIRDQPQAYLYFLQALYIETLTMMTPQEKEKQANNYKKITAAYNDFTKKQEVLSQNIDAIATINLRNEIIKINQLLFEWEQELREKAEEE